MKKKIAILLTAATTLTMILGSTALAAPSSGDGGWSGPIPHEEVDDEDLPAELEIPAYGYVGEDAEIDPTDPTDPPTPVGTKIDVTIPTNLLWAAFASDGGTVSSPDFHITNNSSAFALDVTIESFKAKTGVTDNSDVDDKLTLAFGGSSPLAGKQLWNNAEVISSSVTVGTLAKDTGGTDNNWDFDITGNYSGTFAAQKFPEYTLVLKFALH